MDRWTNTTFQAATESEPRQTARFRRGLPAIAE